MHCVLRLSSNSPATPPLPPLPLHDALPIFPSLLTVSVKRRALKVAVTDRDAFMVTVQVSPETPSQPLQPPKVDPPLALARSEEHTSELQSRFDLVCRLLLEKKKNTTINLSL